jgi:hypothetical protein
MSDAAEAPSHCTDGTGADEGTHARSIEITAWEHITF